VKIITIIIFLFIALNIFSQNEFTPELVGGPCEGCEAVFEYSNQTLTPIDTFQDFYEAGTKLKLTGTIYLNDGTTPAKDIMLYIYHTNQDGVYPTKGDETGWAKRHGYLRGWIKTGSDGMYTFYTSKPGTYPSRSAPTHIHPVILEPDGKYYWIEEYLFEGDPLLSDDDTVKSSPRGGDNFILNLKKGDGIFVGERDVIWGKNVPDYE